MHGAAFGKEGVAQASRLGGGEQIGKGGGFGLQALRQREQQRHLDAIDDAGGGGQAVGGLRLAGLCHGGQIGARVLQASRCGTRGAQRGMAGGQRQRRLGQVLGHHLIDQSQRQRLSRRDRHAGQHQAKGRGSADQPGQPLRAASTGQQTQIDLGQTQHRRRVGDAVMGGQRQFQPTAQSHAMDRRNHRFGGVLKGQTQIAQPWPLPRLAKFGNIGPGGKAAPLAPDHDGFDRRIGQRRLQAFGQTRADGSRQRIDRRMRQHQHRHITDPFLPDPGLHCPHSPTFPDS